MNFYKKIFWWLLLIINLVIILYFWDVKSGGMIFAGGSYMYISLGRITGLLAVFFILLQLVLIGRVKPIEQVFGFDKLAIFHHWVGVVSYIFILAHPIFLGIGYGILSGNTFVEQMIAFLFYGDELAPAYLSVVLFTAVVVSSIVIAKWLKSMKYEKFYFVHLLVYLAILTAFGHQLEMGGDFQGQWLFVIYWMLLYFVTVGSLVIYRFLIPIYNFYRHQFTVERVVKENNNIISVYITGKNLDKFKFKGGQFFWLRFFDKTRWWQAHPFSLSSVYNGEYLRFTIKDLGDFSHFILDILPNTKVFLEGPMGVFTADRAKQNKILAIAGGVGITPIRSMMENALTLGKEIILLCGNRVQNDIIFKTELEDLKTKYNLQIIDVCSADNNWAGECGRIDSEKIIRLCPDYKDRDIYLCGPASMMSAILKSLDDLGVSKNQVHYEKFSLGR